MKEILLIVGSKTITEDEMSFLTKSLEAMEFAPQDTIAVR